jgi:hypothetical protein
MQENAKLNVTENATDNETAEKKRDFLKSFSHQPILEHLLQRIAYDIIPEIDEDDDIQDIMGAKEYAALTKEKKDELVFSELNDEYAKRYGFAVLTKKLSNSRTYVTPENVNEDATKKFFETLHRENIFDAEDARYRLIQFLITGRLESEYLKDSEGREITEDWSDVRESTSYLERLIHPYNHLKTVEDSILIEKFNKEATNILPKFLVTKTEERGGVTIETINTETEKDKEIDEEVATTLNYLKCRFIDCAGVPYDFFDDIWPELKHKEESRAINIKDVQYHQLLGRIKMHYASWLNKLYKASTGNEEVLVRFIEDYRKR